MRIILPLLCLLIWLDSYGQISFEEHLLDYGTIRPIFEDLDNDGISDVIGGGDDWIGWNKNLGDGTFAQKEILSTHSFDRRPFLAVGDLDNDGDQDLAAAVTDDQISWLENDGNFQFTTHVIDTELSTFSFGSIQVVDMDQDGDRDLLVFGFTIGYDIVWYRNEGNQEFTKVGLNFPEIGFLEQIICIDFDLDNDLDIILADEGNGEISWLKNIGNQQFNHSIILEGLEDVAAIAVADLEGDGDMDVLAGTYDEEKLLLLSNSGNMEFLAPIVVDDQVAWAEIDMADINNDGQLDLFGTDEPGNQFWYRNIDNNQFEKVPLNSFGSFRTNFAMLAHVNSDSWIDVMTWSLFSDFMIGWRENNSEQAFTTHILTTSISMADAKTADLDSDGDQDFILGGIFNPNGAWWMEQVTIDSFVTHSILPNEAILTRILARDMDQDGDQDLVGVDFYGGDVMWLENDGHQNFTKHLILGSFNGIGTIEDLDLDLDGDIDLLMCAASDDKIVWLENVGNMQFIEHVLFESEQVFFVHAQDLDGDFDFDLVASVVNSGTGKVILFENDGTQQFASYQLLSVTGDEFTVPGRVSFADFDADDDADFLVGSWSTNQIWLFENLGDLDFVRDSIITASPIYRPQFVDLDGDGDSDIIDELQAQRQLNWYENVGGVFLDADTLIEFPRTNYIVGVSDIDCDYDLDLFAP